MELDKALELAVMSAWQDLLKAATPRSVRVEYECEPGASLDYLTVWAVKSGGYQDLVCDYWTWTSPAHARGVRFANGYHSDGLGQALNFMMKNQDKFTRPADACRHGFVLIYPPTMNESIEASGRMERSMALPPTAAAPSGTNGLPPSRASLTECSPTNAPR
jgi:hypothetical protein